MKRLSLAALALTGCSYMEDGWIFRPFEGPGYTMEGGLARKYDDPDRTYVMAATYLPVASGAKRLFNDHMDAISAELDARPEGLIGYSFGQKLLGREYRTVTVWEDEASMMNFVVGPAHAAAMADAAEIRDPDAAALVNHWEVGAADLPPDWAVVIEKTDGQGREVAY